MLTFEIYGHWTAGKSGRLLPPHTNSGLELVYVANGTVVWDYDGEEVYVPSGHLSYSWPSQVHGAQDIRLPAVDLYWILLPLNRTGSEPEDTDWKIDARLGLSAAEGRALAAALRAQSPPVLKMSREYRRCFTRLVKRLMQNGGEYDLEARGLFLTAMAQLQNSLAAAHRADEAPAKIVTVRQFWKSILSQQLEDSWLLDDMATACGMGRSSFAEATKELFGDTPVRVLTRKRIEAASARLKSSEATVTEIAFQCGFNSSQHFATVFKAYMECSPSDYRTHGKK